MQRRLKIDTEAPPWWAGLAWKSGPGPWNWQGHPLPKVLGKDKHLGPGEAPATSGCLGCTADVPWLPRPWHSS